MTAMAIKMTPCETGNRCKVPKWRDELRPLRDIWEHDTITFDDLIEGVEGLCRHETHPDDWFEVPEAGYGTPPFWRTQRAKARCHTACPVRLNCLSLSLGLTPETSFEENGVWGGYTATQRALIKTEREKISAKRVAAEGTSPAAAETGGPNAETKS